jgi:hypothetical protein
MERNWGFGKKLGGKRADGGGMEDGTGRNITSWSVRWLGSLVGSSQDRCETFVCKRKLILVYDQQRFSAKSKAIYQKIRLKIFPGYRFKE